MIFRTALSFLFSLLLNAAILWNNAQAQSSETTTQPFQWLTDVEQAKEKAIQTQHPILLSFSGSDWCIPCIKLDKKVLMTDTFLSYANDHLIMLRADFPIRQKNQLPPAQRKHNEALAAQYNPNGITPYVVLINALGERIAAMPNTITTPEEYIQTIEKLLAVAE